MGWDCWGTGKLQGIGKYSTTSTGSLKSSKTLSISQLQHTVAQVRRLSNIKAMYQFSKEPPSEASGILMNPDCPPPLPRGAQSCEVCLICLNKSHAHHPFCQIHRSMSRLVRSHRTARGDPLVLHTRLESAQRHTA